MKQLFITLAALSSLCSCFLIDMQRIKGDGNIQSENRQVKNFKGVVSQGSFDVEVSTGSDYSVRVEADNNLLQYIKTDVDGDELIISTAKRHSLSPSRAIKVYVTAPSFNKLVTAGSGNIAGRNALTSDENIELNISGSGNINVSVQAPAVSADISGSGEITLAGEAKKFNSSTAGDGDIKAGDLKTEEASIRIAGSGNAKVNVSRVLDVHIAGSGDVRYTGNPSVHQEVVGSGNIQKEN